MLETQQCNSKSCGIGKHVTMDLIHYEVMTCLSADYNRLTKFDKSYFCCFEITCFSDICVPLSALIRTNVFTKMWILVNGMSLSNDRDALRARFE